mgnify:CR=1 FL=1
MKISELPEEVRKLALLRQIQCKNTYYINRTTDFLNLAFDWSSTIEGYQFWDELFKKEYYKPTIIDEIVEAITIKEEPKHYDNSKGSLYKFCDEHELNSYEFDIIKRVMRCRKKGLFLEDLEKTKFAIDLYIKEQQEKNK